MADWWEGDPEECYWAEITDRPDLGENLWAPKKNVWHYSLLTSVKPGDIVFHYQNERFVSASVAGAPLEERRKVWVPHKIAPGNRSILEEPRLVWQLPLHGTVETTEPLTRTAINQSPTDYEFVTGWIKRAREAYGSTKGPFQLYPNRIRAVQGYLTKLPSTFVEHFPQLRDLASRLSVI